MSRFERFVLAVMWPVAVGLLGLALFESLGALIGRAGIVGNLVPVPGSNSSIGGTIEGWEESGREMMSQSAGYPFPQILAVLLAVGTAVLRSGAWRGGRGKSGKEEVVDVPLIIEENED